MTGTGDGPTLHEQLTRRRPLSREGRRLQREYGDAVAMTAQRVLAGLGVDVHDAAVHRLIARSVLQVRAEQGAAEGDPDRDGGRPLSRSERVRILSRALERAEGL